MIPRSWNTRRGLGRGQFIDDISFWSMMVSGHLVSGIDLGQYFDLIYVWSNAAQKRIEAHET